MLRFPLTIKIGFGMSLTSCQSKSSNATALRGLKSRRRFAFVSLGMTTSAAGVGHSRMYFVTWVRLEQDCCDHPKVDGISNGAFRLWISAKCWANRFWTDGFIDRDKLARISPRTRRHLAAAAELVRARLWHSHDDLTCDSPSCPVNLGVAARDGFLIHDFLEYQPSSAKLKRLSEKRAEAGRRGGLAKPKQLASDGFNPDPTRTDPYRTIDSSNGSGLMLGEINDRLEEVFGVRGFISTKWQPRLRDHLPYSSDEVESAIKEAQAADPDQANGGLVASILIRYRRKPAQSAPKPSKALRYVEPLGPDGLPRSAIREGSK